MAEQFTPDEADIMRRREAAGRAYLRHGTAEEVRGGRGPARMRDITEAGEERGMIHRAREQMERERQTPEYWEGLAESWDGRADEAWERAQQSDDPEGMQEALNQMRHAREQEEAAWVGMIRLEQTWEDGELQPGGRVWVEEDDRISAGWELREWRGDEAVIQQRDDEGVQRRISRDDLYQLNPPPEQRIQFEEELTREEVLQRTRDQITAQIEDAARELRGVYGGDDREAIRRVQTRLRIFQDRARWLDTAEGGENPHHMQSHWLASEQGHTLVAGGGIVVDVGGERRQCLLERYIDTDGSGAPDRVIAWDPATNEAQTVAIEELYRLNPRPGEAEAAEVQQWEAFFGQLNEALDQLQQPGWIARQAQRRENPIKALIRRGGEWVEGRAQQAEGDLAVAVQQVGVWQGMVGEAYGQYKQEKERLEAIRTNNVNARTQEINAYIEMINEGARRDREEADKFYGHWSKKIVLAHLWMRPFDNLLHRWRYDRPRERAERMLRDYKEVQEKLLQRNLRPVHAAYGQAMERMQPNLRRWEEARMRLSDSAAKRRKWAGRARGIARLLGVEVAAPVGAAA